MNCLSPGCRQQAVSGPLCLFHYKHECWTDNSDYDNMGIVQFSHEVFPHLIDQRYGVPDLHKRIYADLLSARLSGSDKMDRLHVIAAPREHSKSTITQVVYVLYCLLYGYARFVVSISESSEKTKQFIRMIKEELETNPMILQYFGVQAQKADDTGKWTESHIQLRNGGRLIALGMGKSPRGLNERTRPDLIIADDVESEGNTITEESRAKNWSWWKQAVVPAADMIRGQCVYIGTMVHYDCILARLLDQQPDYIEGEGGWRKHFYQVYTDESQTATIWPEKFPLALVAKIRREMEADPDRGLDQFYMEYMNIANSPQSRRLHHGIRIGNHEFRRREGRNWVYLPDEHEDNRWHTCHISVGMDPASSKKETAKYTGVVVLATLPDGRKKVLFTLRRRMHLVRATEEDDPGQMDVLRDIARTYHPDVYAIEVTGIGRPITQNWKRELRELSKEPHMADQKNARILEIEALPSIHKDENIVNTLEIPLKGGDVEMLPDQVELMEEMKQFPKGKFKDLLDALCDAFKGSRAPQRMRMTEEKEWKVKKKRRRSWQTAV